MPKFADEEAMLLPDEVVCLHLKAHEGREKSDKRRQEITELNLLYSSALILVVQFFILYNFSAVPPSPRNHCDELLSRFARGLRTSIPATVPTAIILFVATPYIVAPDRTAIARYAILLFCLMGSTLGALLVS
jgi:hypothetical protein